MRIGVISDTHTPSTTPEPPVEIIRAFEGVDLILHAGDIYVSSCLDWLERIAPVWAVEDGADAPLGVDARSGIGSHSEGGEVAPLGGDPRVALKRVEHLEGHTLGMVHDLMLPGMTDEIRPGVIEAQRLPDQALPALMERFFGSAVDIVIFGHTHHPVVEEHQGVLLVNPGSPTLPMQMRRLGQVAILELTPEGRTARIVNLAQFS